jgi:hypothetical protein
MVFLNEQAVRCVRIRNFDGRALASNMKARVPVYPYTWERHLLRDDNGLNFSVSRLSNE